MKVSSKKRLPQSVVLWVLLVILVLIFGRLAWQEFSRWERLYREVQEQETEVAESMRRTQEISAEIERISSPEYIEEEARRTLNLKKEGEEVFVVVGVNEIRREEHFGVEESPVETKNELWENIYAWWRYFIH